MSENRQTTVLVVDDEPELVSLYATWLEAYDVRTATDGEEALDELTEEIDVALLDRRMPGMTGDDVLEEIRDRELDYRIAMITAVEPDVDIVDLPFDDYLVKPVDRHEIQSVVEVLVKRSEYDDQSQEFFMLASKKATLESAEGDYANTEEYRELVDQMSDVREGIDETLDDLEDEDYEAAFHEIG